MSIRAANQSVKRFLIRVLRTALGSVEQKPRFEGSLDSIAILAQEKMGDAILLTPLFRNVRRAYPAVKIHVIAMSPIYPFFESDPHVDVVYRVKQNWIAYLSRIRNERFDVLFSTKDHPSFSFLLQSRLIKARFRVGIYHPYHEGFFHHLIERDFHQHIVEKNCALLDFLNIPYTREDCRPYLPEEKISDAVKTFVSLTKHRKCIGINLSAGESNREWPLKKWKAFLAKVKRPMVVFATADRIADKRILEKSFDHVISSPQTRSIREAGEMIRCLGVLVSPDTSLIHVASCTRTRVVGLYKADRDHVRRFYPYMIPNRMIISKTNRVEDIPVESVVGAVEELLKHRALTGMYFL